ncbi:hypothetical protein [Halalkaliarchaeum sp. AArc-CO]|uniref:hypothetical protein n=1 Tax=Halalkaliarchaeum sp. AArc-CO TaxID=2866381 RepID=UPI00217D028B|nr:hypothetical protein [Halalkaliarchaeum sp. AArc-CO]
MSTPRSTPRGPADRTAEIAERAWQNTVASAILIPAIQLIFLELAEATHSLNGATLGTDPVTILYTGIVVLGLIPIFSTIVATAIAYIGAGWPGVILYYIVSVGASMMLGAQLTGVLIFLTGIILFLLVTTIKSKRKRSRRTHPPMR